VVVEDDAHASRAAVATRHRFRSGAALVAERADEVLDGRSQVLEAALDALALAADQPIEQETADTGEDEGAARSGARPRHPGPRGPPRRSWRSPSRTSSAS